MLPDTCQKEKNCIFRYLRADYAENLWMGFYCWNPSECKKSIRLLKSIRITGRDVSIMQQHWIIMNQITAVNQFIIRNMRPLQVFNNNLKNHFPHSTHLVLKVRLRTREDFETYRVSHQTYVFCFYLTYRVSHQTYFFCFYLTYRVSHHTFFFFETTDQLVRNNIQTKSTYGVESLAAN